MTRGVFLALGLLSSLACNRSPPVPAKPPPCTTDTWDNYGNAFFEEQCNNCHETTYKSQRNVQMLGWSVIETMSHGRMPPKDSPPLSAEERDRMLKYLRCNAP